MPEKPLIAGTTTQNGLVAESDFSYEAPDAEADAGYDLRSAEKDFISQFVEEMEDAPPAPEAEVETEVDPDAPPAQETEDKEEEEVDPDPKMARGVQRLVQRELAAKSREDAAQAREAAAEAKLVELRSLSGLKSTKELAELADYDVIGMFKALGKDPDTMIKMALAQHLGDSAPASLKDFAKDSGTKRRIAELEARLAAGEQTKRASEYFNTIQMGAREYVAKLGSNTEGGKKVGDNKSYPTLAKAVKVDTQYVQDEIMEEIVKQARISATTDPDGEPISYDEAAKRVETRLARIAKLISVQNGTNPGSKDSKKPAVTPPSTKSASKPLAPWQRKTSNIEEDGLQEALREYERAEATRKASRR